MTPNDAAKVERLMLAERLHWTFDYINSMDEVDFREALAILDAVDRASAYKREKRA
jgi:hypothetical protein